MIRIVFQTLTVKAGHVDHIWPVRLHLTYIIIKQAFNTGFGWSNYSGQLRSRPLAFPTWVTLDEPTTMKVIEESKRSGK